MKKYLLSTACVALVGLACSPCYAECDGIYAAFRAGVVEHDVEGDTEGLNSDTIQYDDHKLMLSGALGYRYKHFRGEFEYVWRDYVEGSDPLYSEKYKTYSYMLNAYWDFMPYHWWSPYVNAGIGFSKLKVNAVDIAGIQSVVDFQEDTTKFSWSVGAGLSLKVTNRLNVDAGYRYFDLGSMGESDDTAQEIYGGIRYVF
ncbi:MAG: porin family protein [Alphaproteobacteria bacterium]|nr:porin family protein [Alphaproteobacteria bacterium]